MKASVITCFESNGLRQAFLYELLQSKGYEVSAYTSNFSHVNKSYRNNIPEDYIAIDTLPYRKNLSFSRIRSHRKFAKDVFESIGDDIDLIWLMVPANSLLEYGKEYKSKHPDVRLVVDMIDMWPESLPVSFDKNKFPFNIWRNIRSNNIDCADYLVCECNMYKDILNREYDGDIHTLYWASDLSGVKRNNKADNNKLSLCYIGSINNIIDTEKIVKIIESIDTDVDLHIIGDGENRNYFVDRLSKVCNVNYHGKIYDEDRKEEIMSRCHAGINIYKDGLYIGLTSKCIDYFRYGLPIINNIKGDTYEFVEQYGIGINVNDRLSLDADRLMQLRDNNNNIYKLYDNYFSKTAFMLRASEIIDGIKI